MKKTAIITLAILVLSADGAFPSTNKPLERIGDGINDMVYSTPVCKDCAAKTSDDLGRGIARFVGGLWKIATFWYPEDDPVTCAPRAVQ